MKVKIINKSTNPLPRYQTKGSAGLDIAASLIESVIIQPLDRALIPTGLYVEIPQGFEMQIRPRSGLAINYGIGVLNSPGTIDSDYRGEIKIILVNQSRESFTLNHGDRIAQGVVVKVESIEWQEVDELETTERSDGGFGSTKIK